MRLMSAAILEVETTLERSFLTPPHAKHRNFPPLLIFSVVVFSRTALQQRRINPKRMPEHQVVCYPILHSCFPILRCQHSACLIACWDSMLQRLLGCHFARLSRRCSPQSRSLMARAMVWWNACSALGWQLERWDVYR